MNRQKHKLSRRILAVLLMAAMLITMLPSAIFAAPSDYRPGGGDSTQPENAVSINKTAERVGPDTWNVTMTVKASKEIQSEPLELVLLLDRSGSMAWCTHSDHGYEWGKITITIVVENGAGIRTKNLRKTLDRPLPEMLQRI